MLVEGAPDNRGLTPYPVTDYKLNSSSGVVEKPTAAIDLSQGVPALFASVAYWSISLVEHNLYLHFWYF